jgi:hypothetical protein
MYHCGVSAKFDFGKGVGIHRMGSKVGAGIILILGLPSRLDTLGYQEEPIFTFGVSVGFTFAIGGKVCDGRTCSVGFMEG